MERTISYNSKRKGFTLAEVLIVTAIVLVLAGVSIPIFTSEMRKAKAKQLNDLERAAESAAIAAFYAGSDSKGQMVDITANNVCTFLYDANDHEVYVLNSDVDNVQSFLDAYTGCSLYKQVERYGFNISKTAKENEIKYLDKVIIIKFDGRYYDNKGSYEQPKIKLSWINGGDTLIN